MKLSMKSNSLIVKIVRKCFSTVSFQAWYILLFTSVSYLLITVFLYSKKNGKKSEGENRHAKVCNDMVLGRSTCPCSPDLSLQLCDTQMAPACSAGLIITLASSEIA